jgi:hypothetical protein
VAGAAKLKEGLELVGAAVEGFPKEKEGVEAGAAALAGAPNAKDGVEAVAVTGALPNEKSGLATSAGELEAELPKEKTGATLAGATSSS